MGVGGGPVGPGPVGRPTENIFVWGKKSVTGNRTYVGNLAYSVRVADLQEHFGKYGEVVYAEVLERMGRSQGGGLVEYAEASQKEEAMRSMQNHIILGRPIFLREDRVDSNVTPAARPPHSFGPPPPSMGAMGGGRGGPMAGGGGGGAPGRGLWVGNLPYTVSWQQLKDVFRDQGTVERADIQLDGAGRSRGSGVVTMARPEDASRAIRSLDGTLWAGRRIEVREDRHNMAGGGPPGGGAHGFGPSPGMAHGYRGPPSFGGGPGHGPPPSSRPYPSSMGPSGPLPRTSRSPPPYAGAKGPPGRGYGPLPTGPGQGSKDSVGARAGSIASPPSPALRVSNLPYSTTREDLDDLFKAFGPMDRCVLDVDGSGAAMGTGSVLYLSQQAADRSVSKLNGYLYGGRKLEVRYDSGRRV
ncbi:hypothetical protein BJ684DRAFT_9858 [Piptocephalis cylindrospora]|uniref:RRM domain-containing protein n=1 Tax=Piptocephalis cylindrospora TaxID=1907219 RepID=A0A4P9Y4J0_9FUNG|nr:hypothetical protein BJ684DRAFT_9858 [Piptocephalis cylindrospora]|eukprot:RKP13582.1 hypothetical protein BJ684DRAFT_9858 [Piptocephalis cylindrospora]